MRSDIIVSIDAISSSCVPAKCLNINSTYVSWKISRWRLVCVCFKLVDVGHHDITILRFHLPFQRWNKIVELCRKHSMHFHHHQHSQEMGERRRKWATDINTLWQGIEAKRIRVGEGRNERSIMQYYMHEIWNMQVCNANVHDDNECGRRNDE